MTRRHDVPLRTETAALLRDLLIVELAKAGVPQHDIRDVVNCDMHRVARIARLVKRSPDRRQQQ
jgi:hypothetical protein